MITLFVIIIRTNGLKTTLLVILKTGMKIRLDSCKPTVELDSVVVKKIHEFSLPTLLPA